MTQLKENVGVPQKVIPMDKGKYTIFKRTYNIVMTIGIHLRANARS